MIARKNKKKSGPFSLSLKCQAPELFQHKKK